MNAGWSQTGERLVATVGKSSLAVAVEAYDTCAVAVQALRVLCSPALQDVGVFVQRFYVLIVRCAFLVSLASFSAGAVMAIQFGVGMQRFGAKNYVPTVVTSSILKALAPMLASLMAASRSGGGMAAEVGVMAITQQIDAIKTLGSDPYRKIFAPSIAALVIGLPLLTLVADLAGILGGMLIEVTTLGLTLEQALVKTIAAAQLPAAAWAVGKTTVSGLIIGVVATKEGCAARGGASGIGNATTAAVIRGTIGVLVADLILTRILSVYV